LAAIPATTAQQREAQRLARALSEPELLGFLAAQLGVVKNQAQLLMGLCGLAITVTGFSGTHMIKAGPLSAGSMVVGIALILIGAVAVLRVLLRVRWVSQDLADEPATTAARVIVHRDRQQHRLGVAGVFVALGLAAYLLSVALAAVVHVGGA
jgi:hypothetical protein